MQVSTSPNLSPVKRQLSALSRFSAPSRDCALPSANKLVEGLLDLLPASLRAAESFEGWTRLLRSTVAANLSEAAIASSHRAAKEADSKSSPSEHELIDWMADNRAELTVLHRFDEEEMALVDFFISEMRDRLRLHAGSCLFEGEEILAGWVKESGVALPQALPSIGERAQGGYWMHMSGNARQSPHLHGVVDGQGDFLPGTGGRFLVGLFGAEHSTVRHPGGVIRVPRGCLALIHFPQSEAGTTAHQFWNEDEEEGVGNLLFSFHGIDIVASDDAPRGSGMMSKRTYEIGEKALEGHPEHGFVIEGGAR